MTSPIQSTTTGFPEIKELLPPTEESGMTPPNTTKKPAFDFEKMIDWSVNPGDDFYYFAGGSYLKTLEIPKEYSSWGSFNILDKEVEDRIQLICQSRSLSTTHEGRLVEALYASAMKIDEQELKQISILQELLKEIDQIQTPEHLFDAIAHMNRYGFFPFFSWNILPNPSQNTLHILHLGDGGIHLPDFEIYLPLKDTNANKNGEKREKYKEYIQAIFRLSGDSVEEAAKAADEVMELEEVLAGSFLSKQDARQPDLTTHIWDLEQLQKATPNIKWSQIFTIWEAQPTTFNVKNPAFFAALDELFSKPISTAQKKYLKFSILTSTAPSLGGTWHATHFDFFDKTLTGTEKTFSLEEAAVQRVNSLLPDAIGRVYVEQYFSAETKNSIETMVVQIKAVLKTKISNLSWMTEQMKKTAINKVDAMTVLVGYPDDTQWRDYQSLTTIDVSRPYAENVLNIDHFDIKTKLKKIGTHVNKREWSRPAQIVNAVNTPTQNRITLPAGILQHPFVTSDPAVTWGAIATVIAHEITHSFDDKGRKYDALGNKIKKEDQDPFDAGEFKKHAQVLEEQFSSYFETFSDGTTMHVDGKVSLGEIIADLGGVILAYEAMQQADALNPIPIVHGWTKEQRFFLGFAQMFLGKHREEKAKMLLSKGPHPLGHWRINGTLSQMPEFQLAFGLEGGCPMVVPKDKRCELWREQKPSPKDLKC